MASTNEADDLKEEIARKRKAGPSIAVLNICEPIEDALQDGTLILTDPLIRGDGKPDQSFRKLCPTAIEKYTMNILRTLFTGINNDEPRWRDVCIRFSNLLLLCLQAPEAVNLLRGNRGVASKTLSFSANLFFASSNQCKMIPFNFNYNMLLRPPPPGRAGEPASIPYQMNLEAGKSTMLFALWASFLFCRVLHRTKLVCPSKESTTDLDVRKVASALLLIPEY
jgi:hypothetical protein